jgi:hypothetical protein
MALAKCQNGSQGHTYFNSFLTGKGICCHAANPFFTEIKIKKIDYDQTEKNLP